MALNINLYMKVILKENVPNVGVKGEVKEVSDGYARNFLLAKNLAEAATPEALLKAEKFKNQAEAEKAKLVKKQQENKAKLSGIVLEFTSAANEDGKLFGSIAQLDILAELKKKGIEIIESDISLAEPFKAVGEFELEILGTKIKVKIKAE